MHTYVYMYLLGSNPRTSAWSFRSQKYGELDLFCIQIMYNMLPSPQLLWTIILIDTNKIQFNYYCYKSLKIFRSSGENPVWSSPATGFGPINLPTCGRLQRGRDHSPTRSPVEKFRSLAVFLSSYRHVIRLTHTILSCHVFNWYAHSRLRVLPLESCKL